MECLFAVNKRIRCLSATDGKFRRDVSFILKLLRKELCIGSKQLGPNVSGRQLSPSRVRCPLDQIKMARGAVVIRPSTARGTKTSPHVSAVISWLFFEPRSVPRHSGLWCTRTRQACFDLILAHILLCTRQSSSLVSGLSNLSCEVVP